MPPVFHATHTPVHYNVPHCHIRTHSANFQAYFLLVGIYNSLGTVTNTHFKELQT